jgi:hypothetical protein
MAGDRWRGTRWRGTDEKYPMSEAHDTAEEPVLTGGTFRLSPAVPSPAVPALGSRRPAVPLRDRSRRAPAAASWARQSLFTGAHPQTVVARAATSRKP